MKIYCVKCRKDTENNNPKMVGTKNKRLIMQAKCSTCGIKKSRFVMLYYKKCVFKARQTSFLFYYIK